MTALTIDNNSLHFHAMIGVGGIGAGEFFLLDGNHTLGREESRSGHFLDTRDYCKLHIISHYVKILLGEGFQVIPVGKVGRDHVGERIKKELHQTGICLDYVQDVADKPTLYSFCYLYPDGSGGNMTTNDSACAQVDAATVSTAEAVFRTYARRGIALAVPEVPLQARQKLLHLATEYGFYRIASFISEEMKWFLSGDIIGSIDLLAVNLDEAAALAGGKVEETEPFKLVEKTIQVLGRLNPDLQLSITHGKHGSWIWDGREVYHLPAHKVSVSSAAGAGDAHLAGIIAALSAGLSLRQAHHLGTLTAAHSVTSPHTINPDTNCQTLYALYKKSDVTIDEKVIKLLEERF